MKPTACTRKKSAAAAGHSSPVLYLFGLVPLFANRISIFQAFRGKFRIQYQLPHAGVRSPPNSTSACLDRKALSTAPRPKKKNNPTHIFATSLSNSVQKSSAIHKNSGVSLASERCNWQSLSIIFVNIWFTTIKIQNDGKIINYYYRCHIPNSGFKYYSTIVSESHPPNSPP